VNFIGHDQQMIPWVSPLMNESVDAVCIVAITTRFMPSEGLVCDLSRPRAPICYVPHQPSEWMRQVSLQVSPLPLLVQ
jgi:hypothetical protein